MPSLLYFTRFENLKIIKIRIPSHPCHIVTVHSEVCPSEAVALLICENFGGQFCQFFILFSIQGVEEFCIQSFLGGGHDPQVYSGASSGMEIAGITSVYIKVIALYQAQLCRTFSNQVSGSQTLRLWSLPKGRNCQYHTYRQVLPSALCRSGQTLHRFPPEHSGPCCRRATRLTL